MQRKAPPSPGGAFFVWSPPVRRGGLFGSIGARRNEMATLDEGRSAARLGMHCKALCDAYCRNMFMGLVARLGYALQKRTTQLLLLSGTGKGRGLSRAPCCVMDVQSCYSAGSGVPLSAFLVRRGVPCWLTMNFSGAGARCTLSMERHLVGHASTHTEQ